MQEISSLVRQRLAARQAPQTHPDPDLLTAYVEQALGETERSQVVEHLAACSHCREVVSLSLPEQPVQAAPAQPSALWARFWLPAFRWTAVAATIAIAAALVIEKPWHHTATQEGQLEQKISSPNPAPGSPSANNTVSPEKTPVATLNGSLSGGATRERPKTENSRAAVPDVGLTATRGAAAQRQLAAVETQNRPIQAAQVPPPQH